MLPIEKKLAAFFIEYFANNEIRFDSIDDLDGYVDGYVDLEDMADKTLEYLEQAW